MATDINPSGRLLIYTKKNNDPSIEPWGTPNTSLRIVHWEQLFEIYRLRIIVEVRSILHIFPKILVCTSVPHARFFQKL